jgi:50S ribosomal subunit-associated GTPase HflX
MLLCANKFDLIKDLENLGALQTQIGLAEFARDNGFSGAIQVSARTDLNVTKMMTELTELMI